MNRIQRLFKEKTDKVLSVYFTAGFPELEHTTEIIRELSDAGVDMIEIGIPFSDPLADGPIIQNSSTIALEQGMSVALLLQQLKEIRKHTAIPLVLMGYLNPILQYGFQEFCKEASHCGIDGLIIPDLPLREFETMYKGYTDEYKLNMIFLVSPVTPPERIREIDRLSEGFIYLVTSAATTGNSVRDDESSQAYFNAIRQMNLRNPLIAGFGIAGKEDFDRITQYTAGAIVGSRFIRLLQEYPSDIKNAVKAFRKLFPVVN